MDEQQQVTQAAKVMTDIPVLTWALVFLISSWGGAVAYIQKLRAGHIERVSIMEFIGELITAAFSGTMIYVAGSAMEVPELFLIPLVGIAGHMGSKLIMFAEAVFQDRLTNIAKRRGWLPSEKQDRGDH